MTFHDCDLRQADLSAAVGLSIHSFPRSRLTGARLPTGMADDFRNTNLRELATATTQQFLTLLLTALFASITVETTSYTALLTDKGGLHLPIVGTELSVVPFFMITPLVLLLLFVYFQLHLQEAWEQIARLPREFPSGLSRGEYLPPWILLCLVDWWDPRRLARRPYLDRARCLVSVTLAWAVVPATLLLFWWRYLPRLDAPGAYFLEGVLLVALLVARYHFTLSRATLRRDTPPAPIRPGRASIVRRLLRIRGYVVVPVIALLLAYVREGVLNGASPEVIAQMRERMPERLNGFGRAHPSLLVPAVLGTVGMYPRPQLEQVELSTAPAGWEGTDAALPRVQGARLSGRKLRSARAAEAFFVRADLRKADFGGADLTDADLRGINGHGTWFAWANLQGANVRGASLEGASFQGATFDSTDFRHASLRGGQFQAAQITRAQFDSADLNGVDWSTARVGPYQSFRGTDLAGAFLTNGSLCASDFTGATLHGTQFTGADLRGARFRGTDLSRAGLSRANLEGADLRGSFSGTGWTRTIRDARNWPLAFYDSASYEMLGLKPYTAGVNGEIGVRVLRGLKLDGTDFTNAHLASADLRESTVRRANFTGAQLYSADFSGADLTGAVLKGADLTGAHFETARGLTPEQVRSAVHWYYASFEPAFARRLGLPERTLTYDDWLPQTLSLAGTDLHDTYYPRERFSGMNLRGANLRNMMGVLAMFTGTDLRSADLVGAFLVKADFRGADLRGANLAGASLKEADLRGANLTGARLTGADLRGANLAGVRGLSRADVRLAWIDSVSGIGWVARARLMARGAVKNVDYDAWRARVFAATGLRKLRPTVLGPRADMAADPVAYCSEGFNDYLKPLLQELAPSEKPGTSATPPAAQPHAPDVRP
ncbi:MAG TPA: pentapeptide repeat-containing protein [Longimicrobium sp.]|nr:pentapeptide repeat-containing protein [Longimicrobium sp.]